MGFIRTRHHGWNAPRHQAGAGLGLSVPTSGTWVRTTSQRQHRECDEIVEQTALRTGLVHRVLLVIVRSTNRTVRSAAILTCSLSIRDGRKTSVRGPRHRDDTDGEIGHTVAGAVDQVRPVPEVRRDRPCGQRRARVCRSLQEHGVQSWSAPRHRAPASRRHAGTTRSQKRLEVDVHAGVISTHVASTEGEHRRG